MHACVCTDKIAAFLIITPIDCSSYLFEIYCECSKTLERVGCSSQDEDLPTLGRCWPFNHRTRKNQGVGFDSDSQGLRQAQGGGGAAAAPHPFPVLYSETWLGILVAFVSTPLSKIQGLGHQQSAPCLQQPCLRMVDLTVVKVVLILTLGTCDAL